MPNHERVHEQPEGNTIRESIWSVRAEDRVAFARTFSILFVIGMGFTAWYEIDHVVTDGVFDTVMAIVLNTGRVALAAIAMTYFRFEGGDTVGVALDIYRQKQREIGRAEGRAEGRVEGRAEGRVEGRVEGLAESRAKIEELQRRVSELEKKNGSPPDSKR